LIPAVLQTAQAQNIARTGEIVTLSGEGIDPDNDDLTITWEQISGERVKLLPSNKAAEPTFTAPYVANGEVKILKFRLTVEDPFGAVDTAIVSVSIVPENLPPTADAGSDQTVSKGDQVTLDGTGTDPDDDSLTFHWFQLDGPPVVLDDPDSQTPSFETSNMPRSSGVLRFQLVVTDGFGGLAKDNVLVKVLSARPSLLSVSAGRDQIVDEGDTVDLEGVCEDKLERELTYKWRQTLGPVVEMSSTADADVSFVAPEIPNGQIVPTAFRFSCYTEGGGTATDTIIVRVRPINDDPIVDAGEDKRTLGNRIVHLTGTAEDSDLDFLRYTWTQVDGDDVTIMSPTRAQASFLTPDIPSGQTAEFTFELTAKDKYGGEGSDQVTITIYSQNLKAAASAGDDMTVDEQTEVTISGYGEDPEGEELSFVWRQIGGERVEYYYEDDQSISFTAPEVANGKVKVLVFELSVDDGRLGPTKDTVTVTVVPINTPPEASISESQKSEIGATVELAAEATDADDDPLTYTWTQTDGPEVELSSTEDLTISFVAPSVEDDTVFTFEFVANDGQDDSETVSVDVAVAGEVRKRLVVFAGDDQTVKEQTEVTLAGSGRDPLKHKITYSWRQLSGEQVDLSSNTIAKPTFVAPEVENNETKVLTFELTISDGEGRTAKDTVKVTVKPINAPPQASAKVKEIK
jgi:hypothetical protein